jgi:hypothetical protein
MKKAIDIWPLNKDSNILFYGNKQIYLFTKNDSIKLEYHVPSIDISFSKSPDWGRWKIFIESNETTELSLYEYTKEGQIKQRAFFKSNYLINSATRLDQIDLYHNCKWCLYN